MAIVATAVMLASTWVALGTAPAFAVGAPWTAGVSKVFISQADGDEDPTGLYQATQVNGELEYGTPVEWDQRYNALGYRAADGYLYARATSNGDLIKIGSDSVPEILGPVSGASQNTNAGTFGQGAYADTYFAMGANKPEMYAVDVDTRTATMIPFNGPKANAADITAAFGFLWGMSSDGNVITRIDPATGNTTAFPIDFVTEQGAFGAAWTYGNGNMAFSHNQTGKIFQISVENPAAASPTFTLVSVLAGPNAGSNDGTAIAGDPTDLSIGKSATPTVGIGETITWNITVDNRGPADSSGYVVTDPIPAGVTNVTAQGVTPADGSCTVAADTIRCNGSAITRGDIAHFVFTGTAPMTTGTVVNTATVFGNERDTNPNNNEATASTLITAIPHLAVTKSSDSGGAALPGQVIGYTVTVTNDGTAGYTGANPAAMTDDLADVLDDATWNDDASVSFSNGSTSAAPELSGNTLTWSGPLKKGETATITYSVTATNAGNHSIINNACVPNSGEDQACATTDTPLPNLTTTKTVDPASGTVVAGGQQLGYTLTYANSGLAPAAVDDVDTLAGVLDDADITVMPSASDPSLTVSGIADGAFGIQGTVAAGATVTVSYQATVKPDATRTGDNSIVNWLLPSGATPPADCTEPQCTINPVPDVASSKSVDVGTGTTVTAGEVLTYTLTFTNSGTAAGPVSREDALAGVLDDATLTSGPTPSDPAISAVLGGDRIAITGTLQPNQTATVSYQVTINPDGERGDNQVSNFLLTPGTPVPDNCDGSTGDCTYNPIPNVSASKTVDPASGTTVNTGDVLSYTLTFTNDGKASGAVASEDVLTDVLDDATLTSGPTSSDAALTAELDGDRVGITGNLAVGQTVTVTYSVTVKPDAERGNDSIANFLVDPGANPPATCDPATDPCTVNPVPHIVTSKAVDPASGTTVVPGDVLSYTLTFGNIGTGAGAVAMDDALADVLDDASLTGAPVSSDPGALTATLTGDRIAVTGTLAADQTVTVTYQVTVLPDGERTNDQLSNYLVAPGAEPPATCDGDDCTVNPIPHIVSSKSADPASGTTVLPGDVLTYTLTFSNVGKAAGDVARDDSLAGVLDDADLSSLPVSSDAALNPVLDGDAIHITGNLQAGQSATVTYTVTVRPDDDRGDNELSNFIVVSGSQPPATCESGNVDCTVNPIPLITGTKAVDPASGSNVITGQVLTYNLVFTNSGAATGDVDYADGLADVLDDATFSDGSLVVSDPTLTAEFDGDSIQVTGPLAAGQTVTVTYQVVVLPAAERGNDMLGNYLVKAGDTPDDQCSPSATDCTFNPIPHLAVLKTSDATPTEKVGDTIVYEVTVTNDGTGDFTQENPATVSDDLSSVLDDATYNDDATAEATDGSDPAVVYEAPILSWTGPLASGDSVVITYTVTTTGGGDLQVVNGACVPNAGEDPSCAETTTGLADIDVAKSVDPTSGTSLPDGGTAHYTLTVTNDGTGAGVFSYTDYLADVLDDATVTSAPAASTDTVTVTAIQNEQFTAKGLLDAGEVATVSYSVTTKSWGSQGNHFLGNWVTETGVQPSGTCEPGDNTCTSTPIRSLLAKTGSDGVWSLAGAAGILLLAGLGLMIVRRRRDSGMA